jgi:hypothetical protein
MKLKADLEIETLKQKNSAKAASAPKHNVHIPVTQRYHSEKKLNMVYFKLK